MQQLYTVQDMEEAIRGKLRLNYGISEKDVNEEYLFKACALVLRDMMALHGSRNHGPRGACPRAQGALSLSGVFDGPAA